MDQFFWDAEDKLKEAIDSDPTYEETMEFIEAQNCGMEKLFVRQLIKKILGKRQKMNKNECSASQKLDKSVRETPSLKAFLVRLPKDLHKKLKIHCARQGITAQRLFREYVESLKE